MRRVSSEEQTPLAGEECSMAPRTAGQGLLAWPGGNSSGLAEMVVPSTNPSESTKGAIRFYKVIKGSRWFK